MNDHVKAGEAQQKQIEQKVENSSFVDDYILEAPSRLKGKVRVVLQYKGHDKPLPAEDPFAPEE